MATDTSTPCPVTPSNGGPYGEPTTTDHTPQQIGRPKFDPNHDAALKNALLLAQEVVSDKRNCRAPREIPTDDAINMAILITDMVRMLNASNVGSNCIVRATAYMEGPDHLSAGHALRLARSDRRYNLGYGQPRYQANSNSNTREHNAATTKDNAQALNDVDPNAAVNHNSTNSKSNKASNLDQENMKSEPELQGNQVDSSVRKPKKKGFWQHRRQKARKSNDAAAANHNTAGGVSVVDGANDSNKAADIPDQSNSVQKQETLPATADGQDISNGHASELRDDKPDTTTKENGTTTKENEATTRNPSDEAINGDSEVKKAMLPTEAMTFEPKAEPDQNGVTDSG